MASDLVFIGYGEAGQAFSHSPGARAFDIDPSRSTVGTLAELLDGAVAVASVVTADSALEVAEAVAKEAIDGIVYMNSVAPQTKQAAAAVIDAAGGLYVDVAVMAPVHPQRFATPLFLSGPHTEAGLTILRASGFTDARGVGDAVGRASTIKMLRSVMYKGMEALTAECLLACERAGVTEEVMGTFKGSWMADADYRLDRMLVHGSRRAAEMAEVAKTLTGLGVEPLMTAGTIERQARFGVLEIKQPPEGLKAKLERVDTCR
jgi:3-hydroxyisobutyrate dehydrogenase-like beta-hydroxyacid dehydrogenase